MSLDDYKNHYELYDKALSRWGLTAQLIKTTEECGELIQQCAKAANGSGIDGSLLSEIADVQIMLNQLKRYIQSRGADVEYNEIYALKIKKLESYLQESK